MNNLDGWQLVILYSVIIIVAGCVIQTISSHVMDLIRPERLKRFELRPYKDGVRDSTISVQIQK